VPLDRFRPTDRFSPITTLTPQERRTANLHHDPRAEATERALDLLDTAEQIAAALLVAAGREGAR
jgi:hypothetical protein